MNITFGLHFFVTLCMCVVTFYAWWQNRHFIWFTGRFVTWLRATHSILADEEMFRDAALQITEHEIPDAEFWKEQSERSQFALLVMFLSTVLLMILIPVNLINWVVLTAACVSTVLAPVVSKTLWKKRQHIRGVYEGYQAMIDSLETLEDSNAKAV